MGRALPDNTKADRNRLMIIVWVNKRNWKNPGPIVNVAVHNAHSFASIGLEAHFVVGQGKPSDTVEDLRAFYGLEPASNFHIHRVPREENKWLSSASASVFREARKLIETLAIQDNVAVFTRESGFLPTLWRLKRNPRIRAYYELHDFYADFSWRDNKFRLKDRREQVFEHLFLPRIDGLVCITPEQGALYRKVFPQARIIALSLGTKPQEPQDPERRRQQRTLVYVGHMHGAKGVSFLSRAAASLGSRGIRTLFLGGYQDNADKIIAHARERGVGHMVEVRAFLPPVEMHSLLATRASLGVVMLADTYYNRNLTCPVKALDYLSHGIPALGTEVPSVRAVMGDACVYLPEDDLPKFILAVEALLDSPADYAAAVAKTRKRAVELTLQNRARSLADFIVGT